MGLHMPLVCPDGAVVAYAWKRQLAGQAGASAVDRTRLALKAFTDQKRRFFPHLEDEAFTQCSEGELGIAKKPCFSHGLLPGHKDELRKRRIDWLKRASSLSSFPSDHLVDSSNEYVLQSSSNSTSVLGNAASISEDQIAVIELLSPSVFRAVVSLHPTGSMSPDAVAFFSTDEGGSYVHARGRSVFHVFRHVTEYADKALQYFQSTNVDTSLSLILRWICSYQTLFTKVCSKCERLLMMDESLALILPPVHRAYQNTSASNSHPNQLTASDRGHGSDFIFAYHIGCSNNDL
ncbi:hypothetical protein IEQ34_006467 [Dendrobium chrysotoxum]|uniref:Mediator of RNA polymerase II transcription subunit 27 n=1 Tax=Dendrobium chrysotoxum TaxID=161865 RepID=A0AAV7GXW3_DENCH|nr:hypothetical protein IEQ34_006467 [Dendrobium chrysotoxum]